MRLLHSSGIHQPVYPQEQFVISPEISILSDYRPVGNFSKFDLQVWLVILDKQLYWGLVHTTPEKFDNTALFLRIGPPSTLICHKNGRSSNKNIVETRGIWTCQPCVLMWTENIVKMEFSKMMTSWFPQTQIQCCIFKFLQWSVDRARVFAVPG